MTDAIKVLVVDDSEDDRTLYRRCLQKSSDVHYDITEAIDGEKGMVRAETDHPDCVLLDYSLPGRNGIEVLKRIRAKDPFVPVVILTGQGNETVAVAAMKEGAQDYIAKSTITPEALERVIRVAIAHAEMQRRINEQRVSLEIFTYALAHDLREPTNTIRSFVDLILKNEKLSPQGEGYFQHVQKASERMQALIDAVYLYTRLDSREQMEKEPLEIADVFKEVEDNLHQLIQAQNISITVDSLPSVTVNPAQMRQLLQNLLSNAIHHGGPGVAIYVGAREQADSWLFSVHDTGPGIEPENIDRIFDPFKRMSSTHRGLGLGLAISRKIVQFHGGEIWCESTPDMGTTFYFTLPKIAGQTITPQAETKIASPHPKTNGATPHLARILLVDDNEADLALNRIMLIEQSHMQCEVMVASDGQEALDDLYEAVRQGNPIDLVLLDINMPVMSGFETLAQIHIDDKLRDTTVVMCSTSSYDVDRRMAMSMGAAGYLSKPPQFSQLKEILVQSPHLQLKEEAGTCQLVRAA